MKFIRKLPDINEVLEEYALTEGQLKRKESVIDQLKNILAGKERRKLLFVGPCSADREDAVIDYVFRLASLQEKVTERFLIIPRVYTSKPRTTCTGYKGLLHRPNSDCLEDNLSDGLIASRKMHLHIIQQTGMFCVDEMLYPESVYYIWDLIACLMVGARSVENQGHRLAASGVNVAVGMKNPMSGDLTVMINSIMAAQMQQSMIYRDWEVRTEGNPYTFAVLRGYLDNSKKVHPNYHYENLCELYDKCKATNLKNMSVVVDCSHGNSNKHYERQIRIAKEIKNICSDDKELGNFIKGLMIESYIEDGSQLVGNGIYGKSITDPCLGWEKTEKLILELANIIN